MSRQNLLGFTLRQTEDLLAELGHKPYRGKQLFKWLYNNRQYDFRSMTDFTKELRATLEAGYEFRLPALQVKSESQDGTVKLLFRLDDDLPVETVLIPDEERQTLCVSSQSSSAVFAPPARWGSSGI
jgi:23S rRNA (adenine2503-C2)-methyltransferase